VSNGSRQRSLPRALVDLDPAPLPAEEAAVLIVGSGVAGLSVALELPPALPVLVATKGSLPDGATRYAQGGISAVLPDGGGLAGSNGHSAGADSADDHLADTLAAGVGLSDPAAVRVLVDEAAEAIGGLLRHGARFDRGPDGGFALTREGGHSRPRILHAGGDATGAEIERALVAAVHAAPNVRVLEQAFLVDLLTDVDGAVVGALLLVADGRHAGGVRAVAVNAGAVVVASGGAGQLYTDTTNPAAATGDGIAAALRAGADLADLEFIQFHPTALHLGGRSPAGGALHSSTGRASTGRHASRRRPVGPRIAGHLIASALDGGLGPRLLLSEALRGEGAILRDQHGDAVMEGVHPMGDLAPRDVVTRGMAARMAALGTDHLLLDATRLGASTLERRFPTIVAACRAAGLDPVTEPLPVSPAAHYLMGGIRTDLDGRSSLPGLFAVGEAACTGVHGANRLASNSLLEGVVFAARAARALAAEGPRPRPGRRWAEPLTASFPPDHYRTNGHQAGHASSAERSRLRQAMTAGAGVLRSRASLSAAASALTSLAAPARGAMRTARAAATTLFDLETANLAQLGLTMTTLAARREESRGAHWRQDAPATSTAWQVRQIARRQPDGGVRAAAVPAAQEPLRSAHP
jgi:L-aspartate oxidase